MEAREGGEIGVEAFDGRFSADRVHARATWTDLRTGHRLPFTLEHVAE